MIKSFDVRQSFYQREEVITYNGVAGSSCMYVRFTHKKRNPIMMTPTIHSNGTRGDDLLSQTVDAILGLSVAINALRIAGPNGRDYYVQQDVTAFAQAQQQHEDRLKKLTEVQADLVAISEAIHTQMTERGRK